MIIKINRLFHGYATIRDYQAKKAYEKKEDLIIQLGKDTMRIPWKEIMSGSISPIKFMSKHERNFEYHLIDYPWHIDIKQQALF